MQEPFDSVPRSMSSSGVSAELRRLAPQYGFAVQDNVVLTRGSVSSVLEHVVVDRYGLLIVAAEAHTGAAIRGTDAASMWTATFSDGRVVEFRNPLPVNSGNESLIKAVLADRGIRLESVEIRSSVVFAGADISHLSLIESSASRVKTTKNLPELFEARYSFPPNSGRLTDSDIKHIMTTLAELAEFVPYQDEVNAPWHTDPAVVASVSAAMVKPPAASHSDTSFQRHVELAGHHVSAAEGPSLRAALLTVGTIFVIVLTVSAGTVFYPQLQAGSPTAWTAALVLLVAVAEIVTANIAAVPHRAARPKRGGALGGVVRFALRLAVVFVIIAAGWVFVVGGAADRIGASLSAQFEPPTQYPTKPASIPANPGVIIAKKRLKQTAPQVYNTALRLNSPRIRLGKEGRTSYTWGYMPSGSSVPASYTLTIDIEGKVVSP